MKKAFAVGLTVAALAGFAVAGDDDGGKNGRAYSINTFAVSKIVSPQKISIVAVPWTSYFTNFTDVAAITNLPVAKVVNSLNLTNGDQLVAYKDGREFCAWTLNVGEGGANPRWIATQVLTSKTQSAEGTTHQDMIVPRGYSFWLKRHGPTQKPFFVHGQYATNAVEMTINQGQSAMLGNIDALRPLNLNDKTEFSFDDGNEPYQDTDNMEDSDRVALSASGSASLIFYWNNKKKLWAYRNPLTGSMVTSAVVPPGEGFWYVRSSKAPGSITVKIRAPNYSGQ